MEVAPKRHLRETLRWVLPYGASWQGNGFYYSRYPQPEKGKELTARHDYHEVYYHRLGDPQSADKLVYETPGQPLRHNDGYTTEDERWLFVNSFSGNNNIDIYYQCLSPLKSRTKL